MSAIPNNFGVEALPDDAKDSIHLKRITRHLFFREAETPFAYIEASTPNGERHRFKFTLQELNQWITMLTALEAESLKLLNNDAGSGPSTFGFETVSAICGAMMPTGAVLFNFQTPAGFWFQTLIGRNLAMTMNSALRKAIDSTPTAQSSERSTFSHMALSGKEPQGSDSEVYFGQGYPTPILKALGVLTMRANLLDRCLVSLLSQLIEVELNTAESLIFSTSNFKARVDLVRSAVASSKANRGLREAIIKELGKATSVAQERNKLVHGTWSFSGENCHVETFQPNTKTPRKKMHVTEDHIINLASKYQMIGVGLETFAGTLSLPRLMAASMAEKVATTPSFISPSS